MKDRFSEFVDRVEREHDRVTVTRNGRPTVVLISAADLEALEERLAIMSDPQLMDDLRTARADVAAGNVVFGVAAVRALRNQRSA